MSGTILRGRAWVFGDNVDTDIITPADTISFGPGDAEAHRILIENAFRAVRPRFLEQVRPGDMLVAGRNFGLGSHCEPANRVLQLLGFSVVMAESSARLFFRNAVAIGRHTLQVPGVAALVREGDELEVDLADGPAQPDGGRGDHLRTLQPARGRDHRAGRDHRGPETTSGR